MDSKVKVSKSRIMCPYGKIGGTPDFRIDDSGNYGEGSNIDLLTLDLDRIPYGINSR